MLFDLDVMKILTLALQIIITGQPIVRFNVKVSNIKLYVCTVTGICAIFKNLFAYFFSIVSEVIPLKRVHSNNHG